MRAWGAAELRTLSDAIVAASGGPLAGIPVGAAAARVRLLAFAGRALRETLPLVDLGRAAAAAHAEDGSLAAELRAGRSRLPPTALGTALLATVEEARRVGRGGSVPSVRVNRGTVPAEERRADRTVFMQIYKQVALGRGPAHAALRRLSPAGVWFGRGSAGGSLSLAVVDSW